MRAGNLLLLPILLLDCVGDTSTTDAGGNDATTNDVVTPDTGGGDVTKDVTDGGGGDGDAAAASKHLYAVNFTNPSLLVFDMPVSSTSQPTATVTANFKNPSDVEIVPGGLQLLVVDGANNNPGAKVFIFNLPITSASTAVTAFPLDFAAIDGTFDNEGNLWLAGVGNKLEKFTPPFTNASVPSQTITMPTAGLFGINITNADELFVGGNGHLYRMSLPTDAGTYPDGGMDNTKVALPTGIAFNGNTGVLVSNFGSGEVDDFAVPVQSTSTPIAIGTTVLGNPARLRVTNGNVIGVADSKVGIVMLDPPQYNSATTTIPSIDGGAVHDVRGVCFGP